MLGVGQTYRERLARGRICGRIERARLMLRKLNDVEDTLIGLTKAVADLAKAVGRVESQAVLSQAELPRKLSEMVSAVMREELARRK